MTTGEHAKPKTTYVWRKFADHRWIDIYEDILRQRTGNRLALITRPNSRRALLEVACPLREEARDLAKEFGGRAEKLSGDWLKRFTRVANSTPLKIGSRLVIVRSPREREASSFPYRLTIPASVAFGTGEHTTTAMSLRLLEQMTRAWNPGWSMVDLGTGSGILALAAKCFNAGRVLAIDNDPVAISTAKENARLNKIDNVQFHVSDVRRWKSSSEINIAAANLFSEVLIEILPKLKCARWLILSGILCKQERDVTRALKRNKIDIVQLRRRGKWVAVLARNASQTCQRDSTA